MWAPRDGFYLLLMHLRVIACGCCGCSGCDVRVHTLQRALQRRAKGGSSGAKVGLSNQPPVYFQ